MIEHLIEHLIETLKNIGVGLWIIGLVLSGVAIVVFLGHLLTEYTIVAAPILAVIIPWAIGKFMRTS